VIVDNLDFMRVTIAPAQADPPLVVDADAVLSFSVAGQALQTIARRSRL
jgi:hypothetical protein